MKILNKRVIAALLCLLLLAPCARITYVKAAFDVYGAVEYRAGQTSSLVQKTDIYGNLLTDEFYFWRNMLSSAEQEVYDQLYYAALTLTPRIQVTSAISKERTLDILEAVRYDNPELFWLDVSIVVYSNNINGVTALELSFLPDSSLVPEYSAAFNACVDSVLVYAATLPNDYEQVKFIHDLLTYVNDYNLDAELDQTAYSAVVLRSAVCLGYSLAFLYYMQRLGIPCALVRGDADGEAHAWNLVKIDGMYYNVDVTWDDPLDNPADSYYYNYFCLSDSELLHTRQPRCEVFPAATSVSFAQYASTYPGSDFSAISYGTPPEAQCVNE